jgi:hypothetical protein
VRPQPPDTATPSPTPTLACETDTASLVVSLSAETVKAGDGVSVTLTLNNEGCVALGLPQYRLAIQSDGPEAVFAPSSPEPVVHYLAVAPGGTDTAGFGLRAVAAGQATLSASVSYEVHLGYPGPAYWGSASAEDILMTVAP